MRLALRWPGGEVTDVSNVGIDTKADLEARSLLEGCEVITVVWPEDAPEAPYVVAEALGGREAPVYRLETDGALVAATTRRRALRAQADLAARNTELVKMQDGASDEDAAAIDELLLEGAR